MMSRKYLFFDVETTGIELEHNHIVQLAAILTDESGKELVELNAIVKPKGFIIPESSTKIHGISHQQAEKEGEHLELVLQEFLRMVEKSYYLVAHNFDFDNSFILHEVERCSLEDSFYSYYNKLNLATNPDEQTICTMLTTTDFVKSSWSSYHQSYKWPRLEELHYKLFGCSFEGAHDALVDVRATVRCFFELKSKHGFYV